MAKKGINSFPDGVLCLTLSSLGEWRMAFEIGKIQTVVGTGEGGYAGDGGPATAAGLERPHGCGIDPQGHLYIADGMNHRVRVVGTG
jgi:NHL repeat